MKTTNPQSTFWPLVDYHMHTTLSDGKAAHQPYVERAAEIGLTEIGFSDHICLKEVPWSVDPERIPDMVESIVALKKNAPLPVKFGIEIDYIPGYEADIQAVLESLPLDYAIGSVHFIDDWNFDSYNARATYREWDLMDLYSRYFKLIQLSAASELFDILGHIDLIKKFGFRPDGDLEELYRETAEIISQHQVCIEINTSGLTKPCREIYPTQRLLELCFQHGIPITLGSDSHQPASIGHYYDRAMPWIQQLGYQKIARFTNRKCTLTEIKQL